MFSIADAPPEKDATPLASGAPPLSPNAKGARVAVGVHDEDGMLEWLELAPETRPDDATAKILDKLLEKSGCSSRMLVTGDARALLGGTLDVVGDPTTAPGTASTARLVRGSPPGAHVAFDGTPVVTPAVWQPLQNQRVRYFRKPAKSKPADAPDAGAGQPGADPGRSTVVGDSRGTPGASFPGAGTASPPEPMKP
jgi:hypothetical protein